MIDKCEPIRNKLKDKKVDVSKYDLCYTKNLSITNDADCTLCRHDKANKCFVCRPNEADEEILSIKDFCTPLKKVNASDLENKYYSNVINICKSYKNKNTKKSKIDYSKYTL